MRLIVSVIITTVVVLTCSPLNQVKASTWDPHEGFERWSEPVNWIGGLPFWDSVNMTGTDATIKDGTPELSRGKSGSAHNIFLGGSTGAFDIAELEVLYVSDGLGTGPGTLRSGNTYIGLVNEQNTTTARISGIGSSWTNDNYLIVGHQGSGDSELRVGGTAQVTSGFGIVGDHTDASGKAVISDAGTRWNSGSELRIANAGSGELQVLNGGSVINTVGYLGYHSGSFATATVKGANSTWDSGQLYVGSQGTATLHIQNGGTVSSDLGSLGESTNGSGEAIVDGTAGGAIWDSGATLRIGNAGSGTLNIMGGGDVSATNIYIGAHQDGYGQASMNDTGSTLNAAADLYVGYKSSTVSTLQVNGGIATSNRGFLGDFATGAGAVTVFGEASRWDVSGDLFIGNQGYGALEVVDGGDSTSSHAFLGYTALSTSKGSMRVADTGSTWTVGGNIYVGYRSAADENKLDVIRGGYVSSSYGGIAEFAGAVGKVLIEEEGSNWTSGTLNVGNSGIGTLEIRRGGDVFNSEGAIGYHANSNGTVLVDGANSKWSCSYRILVGASGTGTLNVTDGGDVDTQFGRIGFNPGSYGEVTIDGAGSTWNGIGPGSDISVGGGGFGRLTVSNGGVVTVPIVNIQSNGRLLGNGTIIGYVSNAGGVDPGTSAGTLHITGEYAQASSAAMFIELASLASFDKVDVVGNVTLDGSVYVSLLGGFTPSAGQAFNFVNWTGSGTGTFDTINTPGLPAGLTWNVQYNPHSVVLSVIGPALLGDFNADGKVDTADYVRWRKNDLANGALPNDSGLTTQAARFNLWRANFGKPPGSGSGSGPTANVPEPSVFSSFIVTALALPWLGRRRRPILVSCEGIEANHGAPTF